MWIFNQLRKVFCNHEWEEEVITGGFIVVDGWLEHPVQYRCKKCGKIRKQVQ